MMTDGGVSDPYFARLSEMYKQLMRGERSDLLVAGDAELVARLEAEQSSETEYEAPDVAVTECRLPSDGDEFDLRVYVPLTETVNRPLLVWCHGGAWAGGDLDMPEADATSREVAQRSDAVVVSVGYRLATKGIHYPAPHRDVVEAYTWAVRNAKLWGASSRSVTLGGASAGANLAAGAALAIRDGAMPMPASLLLVYPLVHPRLPPASGELEAKVAALSPMSSFTTEVMDPIIENYLGAPWYEADGYAMPGVAEDLAALPPTLIVNCEYDSLRASGERFAEQLRDAGVAVEIQTVADALHGHLNRPGLPQAQQSLADISAWIETHSSEIQ